VNQVYLNAWNTRGTIAYGVAEILAGSENPTLQARARRLASCGHLLRAHPDGKLSPAYACGDAICPCCGGRRERITCQYINGLPKLLAAHDGDIVSACFTVQNVTAHNLRSELGRINAVFTNHFLRALKYRLGTASYIKKLEVTQAVDGKAHPHIHAMLALPHRWTDNYSMLTMWQDAGRMRDIVPDVYSRGVPPAEVIRELRYILKQPLRINRRMLNDPSFILAAATSLYGIRTTSAGGAFRQFAVSRSQSPVAHGPHDRVRLEWTGTEYQPLPAALASEAGPW